MASPVNYRLRTEISEGDDPFVNLGTVWMQRQARVRGKVSTSTVNGERQDARSNPVGASCRHRKPLPSGMHKARA